MFKSIFLKYLTAFLLITLGSMLIMTIVITSIIKEYNTNVKVEELNSVSRYVAYRVLKESKSETGNTDFKEFVESRRQKITETIEVFKVNTYSFSLIVTDNVFEILYIGGDLNNGSITADDRAVTSDLIDNEIRYAALSEENKAVISDSSGRLKDKLIFATCPVKSATGEALGYVIVCTENGEMGSLLFDTVKAITLATLWIMLAVIVAVYLITERLVAPIREMSRAARDFAAGKMDVRVFVRGNDEMTELQRSFNNMTSSLAANEESRRLFLANVSHDLRTPMTTISGFIDGILDGAIPEDKRDYYLGIVASEARRLSRLVSALLDITKIQAGERKFTKTPFDVCEICREIIISSVQRIEDKGLSVDLDAEEDNIFVFADKDAIHQILYNLIDNAIKFSFPDTEFSISVKYEGKKVRISVFNRGNGIPEKDLPFVFDRFFKSDKSRGLDKTGTGLGLYIARTICEAHGEKIIAESEEGKWCRFSFTLDKGENQRKKYGGN